MNWLNIFLVVLVIVIVWEFMKKCKLSCSKCKLSCSSNEGFSAFYGDPGNCSNDLHPASAVFGATPWSVVPPSWIGRLDQGNGLIGDDVLSGYSFTPAM